MKALKGSPYSYMSVGFVADPVLGSQPAGDVIIYLAVGCHYFPPSPRLPSQSESITAVWPVPNYTAW